MVRGVMHRLASAQYILFLEQLVDRLGALLGGHIGEHLPAFAL